VNPFSTGSRPQRSQEVQVKSKYRDYLPELSRDFNGRCGYTNSRHSYWGPMKFHVDHFAPRKPDVTEDKKQAFLAKELEYSNLVYACPQVNWAKSNDWPSDSPTITVLNGRGYYDPCDEDYNDHFYRTNGGAIMPVEGDVVALYMWQRLKLYLKRYELYWRMDLLNENLEKLHGLRRKTILGTNDEIQINRLIADFSEEISKYNKYIDLYKNEVV
jgi:hypothetical protein